MIPSLPETRHARRGDVHIAYRVIGDGRSTSWWCPGACPTSTTSGRNRWGPGSSSGPPPSHGLSAPRPARSVLSCRSSGDIAGRRGPGVLTQVDRG